MPPSLDRIDHIHVYVRNRKISQEWYAKVLGLSRLSAFASWEADGGPLTIANNAGSIHLALFERTAQACHSTIAFGVSAAEFIAWREHLQVALVGSLKLEDHQLAWSMYFSDPDGNPYKITTYEYMAVAAVESTPKANAA